MNAPVIHHRLLEARDLSKTFVTRHSFLRQRRETAAVRSLSLTLDTGASLGIVGESGSGKSTLGALLLGLLPPTAGTVTYCGTPLNHLQPRTLRKLRAEMALVHQNPLGALDPRMRLGRQIVEPLVIHRPDGNAGARQAALEVALERVGLPRETAQRYPHQVSGGQRQRVAIARALILDPKLVVFDEAVSALDVSVQAQILGLIRRLRLETGAAYLFISHDLRATRQICNRVAVMYRGRIVEEGSVRAVIASPRHPYTRSLIDAVPVLDPSRRRSGHTGIPTEPGSPTSIVDSTAAAGCAFRWRCPRASPVCAREEPGLRDLGDGQRAACHHPIAETTPTGTVQEAAS